MFFSLGCCCNATCCGGSPPEAGYDVHIELTDADCDLCDEVWSGTFSLAYTGNCVWAYDSGNASGPPVLVPIIGCRVADIPETRQVFNRKVILSIQRVGANYQIDLRYEVAIWEFTGGDISDPSNYGEEIYVWTWQQIVAVGSFDCATASDYHLPRLDREALIEIGRAHV